MFIPSYEDNQVPIYTNNKISDIPRAKMNRCVSHSGVNELPEKENSLLNKYLPHYNIIQKVSIKKPPKPKMVQTNNRSHINLSRHSNNQSSTSYDSQASCEAGKNNYIKTKMIRVKSRVTPPQTPSKPKMPKFQQADDYNNRNPFNGIRTKVRNFLEVDQSKFAKSKSSQVIF